MPQLDLETAEAFGQYCCSLAARLLHSINDDFATKKLSLYQNAVERQEFYELSTKAGEEAVQYFMTFLSWRPVEERWMKKHPTETSDEFEKRKTSFLQTFSNHLAFHCVAQTLSMALEAMTLVTYPNANPRTGDVAASARLQYVPRYFELRRSIMGQQLLKIEKVSRLQTMPLLVRWAWPLRTHADELCRNDHMPTEFRQKHKKPSLDSFICYIQQCVRADLSVVEDALEAEQLHIKRVAVLLEIDDLAVPIACRLLRDRAKQMNEESLSYRAELGVTAAAALYVGDCFAARTQSVDRLTRIWLAMYSGHTVKEMKSIVSRFQSTHDITLIGETAVNSDYLAADFSVDEGRLCAELTRQMRSPTDADPLLARPSRLVYVRDKLMTFLEDEQHESELRRLAVRCGFPAPQAGQTAVFVCSLTRTFSGRQQLQSLILEEACWLSRPNVEQPPASGVLPHMIEMHLAEFFKQGRRWTVSDYEAWLLYCDRELSVG